jgi:hypothetical protein
MEINSKILEQGKGLGKFGGRSDEADTTEAFLTSQNILPAVMVTF